MADGSVLLGRNMGQLCKGAPLKIDGQEHDAQSHQTESTGHEQRGLLGLVRFRRITRVLFRHRFLQHFQPRCQRCRIALGGIHGGFLVLLDGQLRLVDLFLDMQVIFRHLFAGHAGGNDWCGSGWW